MLSTAVLMAASMVVGQAEGVVIPDDARSELKYLVGSWNINGRVGDDGFEGEQVARWAPGKHCLVVSWTGVLNEKKVNGTAVVGWDAGETQILDTGFIDTIGHRVTRWTIESDQVWKGKMLGYLLGNSLETTVRLEKKGDDKFLVIIDAAGEMPENEYAFTKVARTSQRKNKMAAQP